LNKVAHDYIISCNATPSFLGYGDFPASICTSVNDVVVHGVPSGEETLKDGDIIGVDVGVTFNGYIADAARTFAVGKITEQAQKLIDVTKQGFYEGIKNLKAGCRVNEIGEAIENYINSVSNYGIVQELTGHGVGQKLHEDPFIFNFKSNKYKQVLPNNCVLAIEPMINMGSRYIFIDPIDKWSVKTLDEQISAHYENTVIVTTNGVEIITL
ncbi:MAG: type I methionyl aminopeptidase, partial [Firmicutes bacterium]|nr:type I methionyl aminopeptidase [Bacillota bacterium]